MVFSLFISLLIQEYVIMSRCSLIFSEYIIILFIGDGAQITIDQIEQNPDKINRLNRFRERLRQRHTIDIFNDEHEAAWKILAALRNYEIRVREEQQGLGGIVE